MPSPLCFQLLLPTETDIDAFDCGEPEVDDYFRGRKWLKPGGKISPDTYKFQDAVSLDVVGYAAAGFSNCPHVNDANAVKAKYLRIDAVGLNQAFQGQRPPNDPVTYAEHVFRVLETLARLRIARGCVGMALWVRQQNARAIRFYARVGFVADPGGPVPRDQGSPHLTMRKIF